jgi:hypothetical protein
LVYLINKPAVHIHFIYSMSQHAIMYHDKLSNIKVRTILSLVVNAIWRLFLLLTNYGEGVRSVLLNDIRTQRPLIMVAKVCILGEGEPQDCDFKLTLTICFKKICESHKISVFLWLFGRIFLFILYHYDVVF